MTGHRNQTRRRASTLVVLCFLVIALVSSLMVPAGSASRGATGLTDPATWIPWFLASSDQFRLDPPPSVDSRKTKRELRELIVLQTERTPAIRRQVRKWNKGPATLPWTKLELKLIRDQAFRPPVASRALRYLHTAMFDVLIAIRDSRKAHREVARPKPAALSRRLEPLIGGRRGSAFAPLQPALAGAAETVLLYLFPQAAPEISRAADQAAKSRLYAGADYRSDVNAARRLGRSVGALVVERARMDGIDNQQPPWPRPVAGEQRAEPSGGDPENQWQPAPPNYELPFGLPVGTWDPQLMATADQWLTEGIIAPPSRVGSPEFLEQTIQVLRTSETLTPEQGAEAHFWDDPPSATATPPGHWFEIAIDQLQQYPMSTIEATRSFAYLGAAVGDAAIASFGAKYYWWSIRPIHAIWRLCEGDSVIYGEEQAAVAPEDVCPYYDNSTLPSSHPNHLATDDGWYPIIDTPPFPAYPAGHGTFSGAASRVLGYLFPGAGESLERFGELAAGSRLFGGIHFDEDNQAGLKLGRWVGDLAVARAQNDGSVSTTP